MTNPLEGKASTSEIIPALGLFLLVTAVYACTFEHGFLFFDDPLYVTGSHLTKGGLSWSGISKAFAEPNAGNYQPLVWFTLMTDFSIGELNPRIYHMTNVFLHAANSVLLFILGRKLRLSTILSLLIAAAFAFHPQRAESVAWISGRKDLLLGFFSILASWTYLAYGANPTRTGWYWVTILTSAALLSKPLAVTLPIVFLCLDYWPLKRWRNPKSFLRSLREKIPWFLLALFILVMTVAAQPSAQSTPPSLATIPLLDRLTTVAVGYGTYLRLFFFPADLAIIYPWHRRWFWDEVICSCLLIMTISIAFLYWRKRYPALLIGWMIFVVAILPVAGLTQVGGQAYADRYTYTAHIGLLVIFGWLLARGLEQRTTIRMITLGFGISTILLWSVTLLSYLRVWSSTSSLFEHAYRSTWNNVPALRNLGPALAQEGKPFEAAVAMKTYLRLHPYDAKMWNDYGINLALSGRPKEARAAFDRSSKLGNQEGATKNRAQMDEGAFLK